MLTQQAVEIPTEFDKKNRELLANFIRCGTNFMVYGQRGVGKTTFVRSLLKECQAKCLSINCIMANRKSAFLSLFRMELKKVLEAPQEIPRFQNIEGMFEYLRDLRRLFPISFKDFQNFGRIVCLLDNMEELQVSEKFLNTFHSMIEALQLKMTFIYCGVQPANWQLAAGPPLVDMPKFHFPRPTEKFFRQIIMNYLEKYQKNFKYNDFDKFCDVLSKHIAAGISTHINKISEAREYADLCYGYLMEIAKMDKKQQKSLNIYNMINNSFFADNFRKICEYGPLNISDIEWMRALEDWRESTDKSTRESERYFCTDLLKTSLFLAERIPEADDHRKFKDLKKGSKQTKEGDNKNKRIPLFRVLAIAQSLQSQLRHKSKQDQDMFPQFHPLDFYLCLQHLVTTQKMKISQGSGSYGFGKATSKVTSVEATSFMSRNGLRMDQFLTV